MKITALYDTTGLILAAAAIDDGYDGPVPAGSPDVKDAVVDTFEVPTSADGLGLDEICTKFRVEVKSKRLVEAKQAG